ncbi:MAG TPA: hypothetical protein VFE85_04990 [Woeseiaceae bacterium]|nr:hypothetical protein [Woeseiaceae bacterium]
MTVRLLALTVLAALSFSARADFHTVQQAYEVALTNFQAPVSLNGMLTIRECDGCEPRSLRVDANTRYELNQETLDLQQFRKRLLTVRDRDNTWLTVLHHLERDTVTVVSLTL